VDAQLLIAAGGVPPQGDKEHIEALGDVTDAPRPWV